MGSNHPNCPFCIENGNMFVIAEAEHGFLIKALRPIEGVLTGWDNRYLIVPRQHVTSQFDLPDDWQKTVNDLLKVHLSARREKDPSFAWNITYNEGALAGQTLEHLHVWVVFRVGEEGKPSYRTGLATLIERLNNAKPGP